MKLFETIKRAVCNKKSYIPLKNKRKTEEEIIDAFKRNIDKKPKI